MSDRHEPDSSKVKIAIAPSPLPVRSAIILGFPRLGLPCPSSRNPLQLYKPYSLTMNRSKFVAILTGAISLLLAIAYLILVQLLDFRGGMVPAPPLSTQYPPSIITLDIS